MIRGLPLSGRPTWIGSNGRGHAPDEKEFLELTRSKFGIQSYEAIKEFAVLAKQYVPNVVMTVVEKVMPEEKIQKCQEICDTLGVTLRVRPFEN